jgi:hypothetical protein
MSINAHTNKFSFVNNQTMTPISRRNIINIFYSGTKKNKIFFNASAFINYQPNKFLKIRKELLWDKRMEITFVFLAWFLFERLEKKIPAINPNCGRIKIKVYFCSYINN